MYMYVNISQLRVSGLPDPSLCSCMHVSTWEPLFLYACAHLAYQTLASVPVCMCPLRRKKAMANSVGPDETPHDAASHLDLRCLLKGISALGERFKIGKSTVGDILKKKNVYQEISRL
ncbi:hypothetical protein DPMN_144010 [Dreissena polymorpha]|uniref:Uncharacterized protein n=1 Tax=Dreissena polymorpha TaxID=45954 RepID=A0A9D4GEM6_DREPO|nr:hypothetical protein DPMN_144010 [Dreissena polymorpha]